MLRRHISKHQLDNTSPFSARKTQLERVVMCTVPVSCILKRSHSSGEASMRSSRSERSFNQCDGFVVLKSGLLAEVKVNGIHHRGLATLSSTLLLFEWINRKRSWKNDAIRKHSKFLRMKYLIKGLHCILKAHNQGQGETRAFVKSLRYTVKDIRTDGRLDELRCDWVG